MQKYLYIAFICLILPTGLMAQCKTDGWLSCSTERSPNSDKNSGHWIMYDLGYEYNLSTSQIWNYNDPFNLSSGTRQLAVDYSLDGVNWTSWGSVELAQGTGTPDYTGSKGPDLSGIRARYILLTAESNWGGACAGLTEIRFNLDQTTSNDDELSHPFQVRAVPNPVQNEVEFWLESPIAGAMDVEVIDIMGRSLAQWSMNYGGNSTKRLSWDASQLSGGIYFVKLTQGGETFTQRFVKTQ